ncbi:MULTISPECIES: DUF3349 domain-containing protein [Rhodococcus erythropolis group]|uniref:DUF3349 domain-containing protein n=1 Tax=Rhodococcus erythropolis group TaxID=2840174 RepID=UPI001BEBE9CE|nr:MULTISPECIES: DUF3349 domain-containing protein [Rhodococcus erythropolis group]MBT2269676.1 DUF3349 domain-containing protein [Rhodococcus erythropolis]MBT2274193.1 DUF3349 domain-containing protein [Rhodococcus qingshengii]
MSRHPLRSVLDWLRGGYPEGVPDKDHFALLAVLRRRLTDAEIDEVIALSMERAHETPDRYIDYERARALVAGKLHEEPSEEDMHRVVRRLESGGWPGTDTDSSAGEVEESVVEGGPATVEAEQSVQIEPREGEVDGPPES